MKKQLTSVQAYNILSLWLLELHTLVVSVFEEIVLKHPLIQGRNPLIQDPGEAFSEVIQEFQKQGRLNNFKSFNLPSIQSKIFINGVKFVHLLH